MAFHWFCNRHSIWLSPLLLATASVGQDGVVRAARDLPGNDVLVELAPRQGRNGPRWSPKGAKVVLGPSPDGRLGSFRLGPDGTGHNPPIRVVLTRSKPDVVSDDRLAIDMNRDGRLTVDEHLDTRPTLRRNKIWSSWTATVTVRVEQPDGSPREVPYPINLWFVVDPAEPDATPVLRWSRRGWMQGRAETGDGRFHVALAELVMDGVFDERDRWIVAEEAKGLASTRYRAGDDHAWLGEDAWRIVSIHPSGLLATLRRFDPGVSRIEEERARDRFAADRRAPRADRPLEFRQDFDQAEAAAKRAGRPLFVDFETTWCGPCKQMDAMVYTADAVVTAARVSTVVAVKVDGDEHRDLVKRFGVRGYPTMILIGVDGREIRRVVGYQGVQAMQAFLTLGQ